MKLEDRLQAAFHDRTIGWDPTLGWLWRGRGYDDGWATPTVDEVQAVRDAMTAWLVRELGPDHRTADKQS